MSDRGKVSAIVGANWGDEGKGKITDIKAQDADIVVRFQGGSNAGHTILNKFGKFALHQLPSGVFYEDVVNIIGNGCALNLEYLEREIAKVMQGAPELKFQLMIDSRVPLVLPHHILLDELEEARRGDKAFGSTKAGIAPFYSEKYIKEGIQLNEIFHEEHLKARLKYLYEKANLIIQNVYNAPPVDYMEVFERITKYKDFAEKHMIDATSFLRKSWLDGKNILLEGQLGALRDPGLGIYPYVTSSHTLAGFASVGAGLPPYAITEILAVTKAYSSCVGAGPFVTELFGELAEELRRLGGDAGEYGATTGRPRRVGYFDAVATRFGAQVQGATHLGLTNLDVLAYMDEIPVCVAYEVNGEQITDFPVSPLLNIAKPVYTTLPGFKTDIRGIRHFKDLPQNAQNYVRFIEEQVGLPVAVLSNGPKREEIVEL
ncbi:MAG: adenylosuccinate synthase [Clostridiales bacterium]|jgi:adenylosuccinate synthase|nr:adenylosuccinate synthase [Clostridiales bacterium]